MGEGAPKYEPYIRYEKTKDGLKPVSKLVTAELSSSKREKSSREKTPEEIQKERISPLRRRFVFGLLGLGTLAATRPDRLLKKEETGRQEIQTENGSERAYKNIERRPARVEKELLEVPLIEQMLKFGEVRDLEGATKAIYNQHFEFLTEEPERNEKGIPIGTKGKGWNDMREATERMRRLNMPELVKPFVERELPQQLAYVIAIQESRGDPNAVSRTGARGLYGVMPATAKLVDIEPKQLFIPQVAAEASARVLDADRKLYGEDIDLLLYAYNAGGPLLGFLKSTKKEERTRENFYRFMQIRMNAKYKKMKEDGFYVHRAKKRDTIESVATKYGVDTETVRKLNGIKSSKLEKNSVVKVPFHNTRENIEKFFPKEIEMLRYAPEARAKYDALKENDQLEILEASLPVKTESFG